MTRSTAISAVSALALIASAGLLVAGPLSPPAGPVAPTYKTLSEVEPRTAIGPATTPGDADSIYKITQSGSYYLTGDVVVSASGKSGIEVAAQRVTIDLNGYQIYTPSAAYTTLHGVYGNGASTVTVRNGVIRAMGGAGVYIAGADCAAQDLSVLACSASGIYLGGHARATGCTVNGGAGDCLNVGDDSVVSGCTLTNGSTGLYAGQACTVSGCVAASNALDGIYVSCGSAITGCTAMSNGRDGLTACSSTISACHASGNGRDGISPGGGSRVSDCTSSGNANHGINCLSGCVLLHNECRANTASGFFASSYANHLEGNVAIENNRGFDIGAGQNLLIRNSAHANTTNFVIAAGSHYGPIVNSAAAAAPAVSGNTAASTLATTDPSANIVF